MSTLPASYNTAAIYSTVPQFIQDLDLSNGYPLWYYIYASCLPLDQIGVLSRDGVGVGQRVDPNVGTIQKIRDAKLISAISPSDTTIGIFDTDLTWNLLNSLTSSFQLKIEDEVILIPAGNYDWGAPYVNFTNCVRGYSQFYGGLTSGSPTVTVTASTSGLAVGQGVSGTGIPANTTISAISSNTITLNHNATSTGAYILGFSNGPSAAYHSQSMGADGSIYLSDYSGAPGWSQILDVDRCPDYALPWLGQFLGAAIPLDSGLTRQQMVQKIKQRSSFNRATPEAIVAELVQLTNIQLSPSVAPLSSTQIIVLENTQFNGASPYTYNPYAMTLLLPSQYFSNYTYKSLYDAANSAVGPLYSNLNYFISSLGGLYFDLSGSTVPSNSSPYVNFVYRYRPAGLQIFIGGY